MSTLSIKPFSCRADFERMADYFLQSDTQYLRGMGVERTKLPQREEWLERLLADLARPDRQKQTFYVSWLEDDAVIGHSNLNKLIYGEEAFVHLHIWDPPLRRAARGSELLRQSVNLFIRRFELRRLYCEPYAHNPSPNHTLAKVGFRLLEHYRTIPGPINFEQEVNRYVIEHEIAGP